MTARQSILKALYPLIMLKGKLFGTANGIAKNVNEVAPTASFYNLQAILNSGKPVSFQQFAGKKVLIINTASDCGYTAQYSELQQLQTRFAGGLVILAFPSNDFKDQEKGTDEEVAAFCKVQYGISFPIMQKAMVKKGSGQHPVFRWLTDSSLNGWNERPPGWNFSKYLVNEAGSLTHFFSQDVSPLSKEVVGIIGAKA